MLGVVDTVTDVTEVTVCVPVVTVSTSVEYLDVQELDQVLRGTARNVGTYEITVVWET